MLIHKMLTTAMTVCHHYRLTFLLFLFNLKQKRLLTAAKELADVTAKMVEAAKSCASKPTDQDSQEALKRAAENLRTTTDAAVRTTIKRKMIKRLENASKHAAATASSPKRTASTAPPPLAPCPLLGPLQVWLLSCAQ